MSIIRGLGRTLFASYFVVKGTNAALKPDTFVEDAEPVADKLLPLVQRSLPASVSSHIPEDTRSLVRLAGAVQAVGGVAMGTGLGRRAGAALVAASMVPHVVASFPEKTLPKEDRAGARSVLLRNVALLGGALMASRDTAGQPSIAWRLAQRRKALGESAENTGKQIRRKAKDGRRSIAKAQKKAEKKVRDQIGD
ncbi:DoxX family membrane protein [Acidipropionibacterium acidipropionici]|uniref:DoxX family protein n=1 Tax=Acidipropionibacterium acidipropionici TaxID=1748 RepID=A0AAC8YCJ6_9ACTN|nr:DoxX family membrane protein [Acidipropionibacterium acidipropionici]AMS04351.1 DoxX family protein [Acidipropionibacterium acidipropionici]AOZ45845.1 DoxX family protein [Acidipropionibacterium acidipropionici]AZP38138.1 DoxX family membrane protein [Acidipropionibacterium acidipropionici]